MFLSKLESSFNLHLGSTIERALALALLFGFLPVTFYALEIAPKDYPAWFFSSLGLGFFWFCKSKKNILMRLSERSFLILSTSLFIALRIIWISFIPTIPYSDFRFYFEMANRIAQLKPLTDLTWKTLNMSAWGYPVFLGFWYSFLPQSLIIAKLINVLLGLISIFVFYKFALNFGEEAGRISTFMFAIWPAQVMYTSVIGSEHLALLMILLVMLCLSRISATSIIQSSIYSILAGLSTGLAYITRTVLALTIPVAVLWIILSSLKVKQKTILIGSYLIVILLTIGGFLISMKVIYKVIPVSKNLSTLLSGTNFASTGGWNIKDAKGFLKFNSVEEANAYALKIAQRRIINKPDQFALLMTRKILKMWGDEMYGFQWSTTELAYRPPFKAFKDVNVYFEAGSQYFLVFILIFSIIGYARIGLGKYCNQKNLLLLSPIFIAVLFHTVFEAQARYHFPFYPLFFILAAIGIIGIKFANTEIIEQIHIPTQNNLNK